MVEGGRVVGTDVFQMNELEVRCAGCRLQQRGDRRNAGAGKDIAFDEVHLVPRTGELLVGDGDGLKQHRTIRFEQGSALAEEARIILVAHSFDHFDGHQFVVLPFQFTVILQ